MSDRLKELQRQRGLVQEHLAWLDREIAEAGGPDRPAAQVARGVSPPVATESTVAAEAIIAKYRSETESLPVKVKFGCIVYFLAAFALIGLGVLALYLYTTRK